MAREPHHFSKEDFMRAMFGSFIIGMTFLFKGSMLEFATKMSMKNIVYVIILTCLIVSMVIYLLRYRYVQHKEERPLYEFWAKRFFSITISAFAMQYLLIYVYGLNSYLTGIEMFKLVSAIFMPAATAGAAVEMLKRW